MKKSIFLWCAALVLLLCAAYITNTRQISEPEIVRASALDLGETTASDEATVDPVEQAGDGATEEHVEAEQALDFTLPDLDGIQVSLQDFRGSNVYINFWATWCKWCVKEMPDMEKVFQDNKENDLVVLALAVGEDQEKVAKYIEGKNYTFRILLDSDKSITKLYGVKSIPESIFVDREGNVVYKRVGAMNEEQMRTVIGTLE